MRYFAKFELGTENVLSEMGGQFEIVAETATCVVFDLENEMSGLQEQNLNAKAGVLEYGQNPDEITLYFNLDEKAEEPSEVTGSEDFSSEDLIERGVWSQEDRAYKVLFTREPDFFCECGGFSYGWGASMCPVCFSKNLLRDSRIKNFWFEGLQNI